MYKKSSAKIPMLIGMALGFILLYKVNYNFYEPSIGDPVNGRYILAIAAGLGGGVIGLIVGYFVYKMFMPRQINRPSQNQNGPQYNNSKTDELIRLNGLKNSGGISNEEFKKLKDEILKRR